MIIEDKVEERGCDKFEIVMLKPCHSKYRFSVDKMFLKTFSEYHARYSYHQGTSDINFITLRNISMKILKTIAALHEFDIRVQVMSDVATPGGARKYVNNAEFTI